MVLRRASLSVGLGVEICHLGSKKQPKEAAKKSNANSAVGAGC